MRCSHFCALSLLLAVSCVAADTRYLLYSVNAGIALGHPPLMLVYIRGL